MEYLPYCIRLEIPIFTRQAPDLPKSRWLKPKISFTFAITVTVIINSRNHTTAMYHPRLCPACYVWYLAVHHQLI